MVLVLLYSIASIMPVYAFGTQLFEKGSLSKTKNL